MGVETFADRFQEFGGCLQVGLSTGNGGVSEVGRKRGQLGEEVGAAAMPGEEAVHAKAVAQIVNAGA